MSQAEARNLWITGQLRSELASARAGVSENELLCEKLRSDLAAKHEVERDVALNASDPNVVELIADLREARNPFRTNKGMSECVCCLLRFLMEQKYTLMLLRVYCVCTYLYLSLYV